MDVQQLSLRERFQSALRILTGRGDDAVICSFCGTSRDTPQIIVAGPGVAICGSCAYIALSSIEDASLEPYSDRDVCLDVLPEPTCLLPSRRGTIAADLHSAAKAAGCTLRYWAYNCSSAERGDHLSVNLVRPEGMPTEQAEQGFLDAFLGR